jgi:4Fe-4S single cluster domain
MTNNFCKNLSNQLRIEYGKVKPCCWFTESVDITDQKNVLQYQQQIESIDKWDSKCQVCFNREKKGLHSPRLQSFKNPVMIDAVDNNKTSIEIQINKDCNAACLICGPWNSTTWEKYENKNKNIPIQNISDFQQDANDHIKQILETVDFSNAKAIQFLGGEPLRTDSHVRLMESLENTSEITLRYTTNGSYRPSDEILRIWEKFKLVHIQFSIDGVGEHFNYLRWPLLWHQVEDNIKFLVNKPISNLLITPFSYVTTPFSLYYHDRYESWGNEIFGPERNMFHKVWGPLGSTPMTLSATPVALQLAIYRKYGPNHQISKVLQPFNFRNHKKFMEYITYHDQQRKLNWREVFPEISEYFT